MNFSDIDVFVKGKARVELKERRGSILFPAHTAEEKYFKYKIKVWSGAGEYTPTVPLSIFVLCVCCPSSSLSLHVIRSF